MEGEKSDDVRQRVVKAREIQQKRFLSEPSSGVCHANAEMSSRQVRKHCELDEQSAGIVRKRMERMGFSARAYDRILEVVRPIADLDRKKWGS